MNRQWITERVVVETEHYGSNQTAIVGAEGVALVDAPHLPSDAIAWGEFVSELGEVKYLINSDHHPDHTIGNRFLPGTIVAHEITRERLLTEAPTMGYLEDLLHRLDPGNNHLLAGYEVRLPTVLVQGSLALELGNQRIELRTLRGHTRNNVLTYIPAEGVLCTGDIVCEAGLPSFQDATVKDWFDALDIVDTYDYEHLVPGHGQVSRPNVVGQYRNLGREVVGEVASRLQAGQEDEQIIAEVRFADKIHAPTAGSAGYPEGLIEHFQVRSIDKIITGLKEDMSLASR